MDLERFALVRVPVFQEEQMAPDKTVMKPGIDFDTLEQCLVARINSPMEWNGCDAHSVPDQLTASQSEYIADPPRILWLQLHRISLKLIKHDHQVQQALLLCKSADDV